MPFMIHKFRAHFEGSCEELASLLQGIRISLSTVSSPHFSTFSLQINLSSSTSRLVPSRKGCASVSHPHLAVWAQPARPPRCPHRPQPIVVGRVGATTDAPALPKRFPHHSLALSPMLSVPPSPPSTSGLSPVFQENESRKEKTSFVFFFSTSGLPKPFPHPLPFSLQLLPHFSPALSAFSPRFHPPLSLRPVSLCPLSSCPFRPGGGGPRVSMGMEAVVAGKTQRRWGGERGEGEGAAGTWLKEPCGLGGHRAPTTFCFNSCFWPRAPFFLKEH